MINAASVILLTARHYGSRPGLQLLLRTAGDNNDGRYSDAVARSGRTDLSQKLVSGGTRQKTTLF
jgi:hypothetical protein